MTTENPLDSGKIQEQISKSVAMPTGLNRQQRRALERSQKSVLKGKKIEIPQFQLYQLQSVDQLLEEEDISVCISEMKEYEQAQVSTQHSLEWYRFYRRVGIPDPIIRDSYTRYANYDVNEGEFANLLGYADSKRGRQHLKQMLELVAKGKRIFRQNSGKVIVDEDSIQMYRDLLKNRDIPIEDIFKEVLRARAESMELIKLQIEWLTPKPPADSLDEQPIVVVEPEIMQARQIEPEADQQGAFSLADWDLFWTTNHWSQDPNHLVPISTTSREEAVAQFSEIARGEISIKPNSVLKALEFHLQKDVIQRALATRNKYGPEGIRDWVKIKRGRDRIFFAVSEPENKAVFFAAGRDVVYRDI